ncbi:hypothetical protein TNCV_1141241 [Trichonephila clavipes]|nr:hypothetical protein TNCV_1141241 [Trichonephila clavipes]
MGNVEYAALVDSAKGDVRFCIAEDQTKGPHNYFFNKNISLTRNSQCLSSQANLGLYRPTEGMKGFVDFAQPWV